MDVTNSQDSSANPLTVVILAAGMGTRMKSQTPKVLHSVLGLPLIEHVLHSAQALDASSTVVVVGHGRDQVIARLGKSFPQVETAVQEDQNGTGHAVSVALTHLGETPAGSVLVLAGDAPLLTSEDLHELVAAQSGAGAAVLTAHLDIPAGYGRIVRDAQGNVEGIVEHADATTAQLALDEVNSGVYVFDAQLLASALSRVGTANAQGEQYLTDVIGILREDGHVVRAVVTQQDNILGVNDRQQLSHVGRVLRDRIVTHWQLAGVTIVDPQTTWIERSVTLEADAVLLPNVTLSGLTTVAAGASVGPDCSLSDTQVAQDAQVVRTTAYGAIIGAKATVGPYTYLRPGTVLGVGAKAGGFVEMKNATLGDDAKVPHLSYVGDATIGEGTNVGAATIFVNYDGVDKHHTIVGKHVRIGSDTMLVAPVTIGDGAYTAAGSVVTEDVPPGAIAVARSRQRNIIDWVLRRRPGSTSAQAAVANSSGNNNSSEGS